MTLRNNFKKYYIYIFFLVLLSFVISSHNAWWQNRIHEGKYFVIKYPVQMPFMWQYDLDAREVFKGIAYFPNYYKYNRDFISRPVMPLLANYIGSTIYLLLDPLIKFISINQAILSITFLFLGTVLLHNISMYHFYEFQILTPIIIIFLFVNIVENYSFKKNVIFSLVIGILMLIKANYAVYLAILIFSLTCFINKKLILKIIFISIIIHLIPFIVWHVYLDVKGIGILGIFNDSNNINSLLNPFGIILNNLINPGVMTKSGYPSSFSNFINFKGDWISFLQYYQNYIYKIIHFYGNIWVLLTIYFIKDYNHKYKKTLIYFILIFILFTIIQAYIAFPNKVKTRLLMDSMFILYTFGMCVIYNLVKKIIPNQKNIVITLIMIILILTNILPTVSTPWIHPLKQIGNNGL